MICCFSFWPNTDTDTAAAVEICVMNAGVRARVHSAFLTCFSLEIQFVFVCLSFCFCFFLSVHHMNFVLTLPASKQASKQSQSSCVVFSGPLSLPQCQCTGWATIVRGRVASTFHILMINWFWFYPKTIATRINLVKTLLIICDTFAFHYYYLT